MPTPTINYRRASDIKDKFKKSNSLLYLTSWYCHGCGVDAMRQLIKQWYHEKCAGMSSDDKDDFECPNGCNF